jgi:hypothetical protein
VATKSSPPKPTLLHLRELERRAAALRALAESLTEQMAKLGLDADPRSTVFLTTLLVGMKEDARLVEQAALYWAEAHKLHFGFPPEATARPTLSVVDDETT